jgi:hypothetical protein
VLTVSQEAFHPALEVWIDKKLPVLLVRRWGDPEHTFGWEHVYRPSGMYFYERGAPVKYHYTFESTNRFDQGGSHVKPEQIKVRVGNLTCGLPTVRSQTGEV